MSDMSPAERSTSAWKRISDILDEATNPHAIVRCWTCRTEWDETDMEWTDEIGPECPDCRERRNRQVWDSRPTMSEMRALTLAPARTLCSGCANRHDPDDCPYYG